MNRLIEFLKTTAFGGLFVVLPVLLFALLISEILELIVALATPIADLFPEGTFDEVAHPVFWALVLLVAVSFVIGLALRAALLRRLGAWVERDLLGRVPLYPVVKRLSRGLLAGPEDAEAFRPALLESSADEWEVVYVIETLEDGRLTVLAPWAPAAFAGGVKIVRGERVRLLDAGLGEVSRAMSHWGTGLGELTVQTAQAEAKSDTTL
jgi:uncharacterized membrane protein